MDEKKFEVPQLEIVEFQNGDIITVSNEDDGNGDIGTW